MKSRIFSILGSVLLIGVMLGGVSRAGTVTVDCGGGAADYPNIRSALAALDMQGPHDITVAGTCDESVNLYGRENIALHGTPTARATILRPVNIDSARNITLMHLNLNKGVNIYNGATAAIVACTLERASGWAIDMENQSLLNLGSEAPEEAVLIHNSRFGIIADASTLIVYGNTTIENNAVEGINIESGRAAFTGRYSSGGADFGGANFIRNNGLSPGTAQADPAGLVVHGGANVDFGGQNFIQGNGPTGVIVFDGGMLELGGAAIGTDGVANATTIEGHTSVGAQVYQGGSLILGGLVAIRNNGSAGASPRGGVSLKHNSHLLAASKSTSGPQISGNTGSGIVADLSSVLSLRNTTISNNTEAGISLLHLSAAELISGVVASGNATDAVCDGTSVWSGDDSGVVKNLCKTAKK